MGAGVLGMGSDTTILFRKIRREAEDRRYLAVTREGPWFVVTNRVTRSKRYYARIEDVRAFLARGVPPQ